MKKSKIGLTILLVIVLSASVFTAITITSPATTDKTEIILNDSSVHNQHDHNNVNCVFKTVFEGQFNFDSLKYNTPADVQRSIEKGLEWIVKAQSPDGGWGAGSHYRQDITDPHQVNSDPATTAMVSMAILRCDNVLSGGKYSVQLNKALNYLFTCVETSAPEDFNITKEQNTQPQIKLGQNIDVVLTSQFLTNILDHIVNDPTLEKRTKDAIQVCVNKIQSAQTNNGSFNGGSWAGVLQSSFATGALEAAEIKGIDVSDTILANARKYQSSNYDEKTGTVRTDDAAGVMLYSVSSTSRNTAQESNTAKINLKKAKEEGKLDKNAEMTVENLQKAGMSESEALTTYSAYKVNESAKMQAISKDIMVGFGNNGGEEFLSFLQTGEGLIISNDNTWKKWYDNISKTLVNIQEEEGNWSGHHCITSPVFCTATSLLILSINNDVEELAVMGHK
ncbi:MAG: hypothetical protein H7Y00_12255 [Fimbriimonadaceae bacterium]|nr:hypothetical protein [Chitinophagales bacterium]